MEPKKQSIEIHENSNESEIIVGAEERISDLSSGDALAKRAKFNGAQLECSVKEEHARWQEILGLESENEDDEVEEKY
jgi:hypothetical protein